MCLQSILIINCFPCTYRYVWMCRTIDGLTMILNEFSSFTTFLPGVCCILYKQFFYRFFRVPRISFVNGVFFIIIFDCMHSVLDALKSSVLNKAKKKREIIQWVVIYSLFINTTIFFFFSLSGLFWRGNHKMWVIRYNFAGAVYYYYTMCACLLGLFIYCCYYYCMLTHRDKRISCAAKWFIDYLLININISGFAVWSSV